MKTLERPQNEPNRREGLFQKFKPWIALLATMALLSGDLPKSTREDTEESTIDSPRGLTEAERRALHTLQCRQIEHARKKALDNIFRQAPRREQFLNGFAALLSCADFKDSYDPTVVCMAVTEEINNHPKGMLFKNKIIRPFFDNLYLELQCQGLANPNIPAPHAVKQLFALLKVEIERNPPKGLDPRTPIKELCNPGFELVAKRHEDIVAISQYILKNHVRSKIFSERIKQWKDNYQKEHQTPEPPTEDDLQKSVARHIGWTVAAAKGAGVLCRFVGNSDVEIVKMFKKDVTAKELMKKRGEMFPLLRELVEMIAKDKTPEGEKAYEAMRRIAEAIVAIR
jgi:hypothetical protein